MTGVLRWEQPPGARPIGAVTFHHAPAADALRANRGVWAVVAESPANTGLGWLIKNGKLKCWQPAGSFQSATRTVNGTLTVYARYVGEVTS